MPALRDQTIFLAVISSFLISSPSEQDTHAGRKKTGGKETFLRK